MVRSTMGMFPRLTLSRCFRSLRGRTTSNHSQSTELSYVLLSPNVADEGAPINAIDHPEEEGRAMDLGLGVEAAHEQFEECVQGSHEMTACALAAIDACSADVPQTVQLLELLAQQGSDREKKQECLALLQSSFEKHMTEYEEEEQKYTHNLWGSMSTQQQDLQVRLDIGNRLQTLRLQKQKLGEALLWLELMSGPAA